MPRMRWFVLSVLVVGLFASGCTVSREVHLWPIVDLERPDSGDGVQLSVAWPLFGLDTTGPEAEHYLYPLYSYDGTSNRGTMLSWLISFRHGDDPYFRIFPMYWWGERGKSSWHVLLPLAGRWRKPDESTTYVFPYVSHEDEHTEIGGTIVPPLLFSRDKDGDAGWSWVLNTYHSWDGADGMFAFWPLFATGESEIAETEHRWTWVFPTFSSQRSVTPSGDTRHESSLWPIVRQVSGVSEESFTLGSFFTYTFDGWHVRHLFETSRENHPSGEWRNFELFPLYAHRELRAGSADEDSPTDSTLSGSEQRIPIFGWSSWENLPGVNGISSRSSGWSAWPFYSRAVATERSSYHHRALAGLYRYDVVPDKSYRLALLHPLQEVSSDDNHFAHRFWPLYRYGRYGDQTSFSALAELVGVRRVDNINRDPLFLLHPISYQSTGTGDYDFRFMWKWIESRNEGDRSRWAVHPLVYRRDAPDDERFLLLGGLVGTGKKGPIDFVRLLWIFDIEI